MFVGGGPPARLEMEVSWCTQEELEEATMNTLEVELI